MFLCTDLAQPFPLLYGAEVLPCRSLLEQLLSFLPTNAALLSLKGFHTLMAAVNLLGDFVQPKRVLGNVESSLTYDRCNRANNVHVGLREVRNSPTGPAGSPGSPYAVDVIDDGRR